MKKIVALILIVAFGINITRAQNSNTLYVMENVFQNQFNNPAFEPVSKFTFNLASASAEVGFSGFALGRLIDFDGTNESETLNPNDVVNNLRKNNELLTKVDATIFGLGFKIKSTAFQISLRARSNFSFNLPQDLVRLAVEGNGDTFLRRPADLSNTSINLSSYAEFGIAASFPIGNRLRLGGKIKFLSGFANIRTEQSELTLTTDSINYGIAIQGAYHYRTSNVDIDNPSAAYEGLIDSLSQFKFQNTGIGFDFGFQLKLTEKIKITGALLDLGAITWDNRAKSYQNEGFDFKFDGVDLFDFIDSDSTQSTEQELFDSLKTALEATEKDEVYTALLPTRLIGSFEYKLTNSNFVGAVINAEYVPGLKKIRPEFRAYYRLQLGKTLGLGLSNAFAFNSFVNPGAALTFKLGIIQVFVSSDNILGLISPKSTRSASAAFGANLVFGGNRGIKDLTAP